MLHEAYNNTLHKTSAGFACGSVEDLPGVLEGMVKPLPDPETVDSERRTIEWLTQLSEPNSSVGDVADLQSMTSCPRHCSVSAVSYTTGQSVGGDSAAMTIVNVPVDVRGPDPSLSIVGHTDSVSDILLTVDQTSTVHYGDCTAQTEVRSRFVRLVRPVNRLIQTMSRQHVVLNKLMSKLFANQCSRPLLINLFTS